MISPDARLDRDERIEAILLGFVASYVDTAVFGAAGRVAPLQL